MAFVFFGLSVRFVVTSPARLQPLGCVFGPRRYPGPVWSENRSLRVLARFGGFSPSEFDASRFQLYAGLAFVPLALRMPSETLSVSLFSGSAINGFFRSRSLDG